MSSFTIDNPDNIINNNNNNNNNGNTTTTTNNNIMDVTNDLKNAILSVLLDQTNESYNKLDYIELFHPKSGIKFYYQYYLLN